MAKIAKTDDQRVLMAKYNMSYRFETNQFRKDYQPPDKDNPPSGWEPGRERGDNIITCCLVDLTRKPHPRSIKGLWANGMTEQEAFDKAIDKLKELPEPRSARHMQAEIEELKKQNEELAKTAKQTKKGKQTPKVETTASE